MALLCVSKKKIAVNLKTWKRFTHKLRTKFRDINIAPSVRDSTSRLLSVISHHLIIPFRTRKYRRNHSEITYWQLYQYEKNSTNTKANEVESQYESQRWRQGEIKSDDKVSGGGEEKKEEEGPQEIVDSMEDAWMRVVAASPHLRVDEKSDQFINKFREAMRLEKERSLLEFQERLIRRA
ncbi:Uncharacterized protein Rs2_21160 [Raphanus sativus]|nr:Uncharacterized protein Rs2_21160 [Raphanus sativus]